MHVMIVAFHFNHMGCSAAVSPSRVPLPLSNHLLFHTILTKFISYVAWGDLNYSLYIHSYEYYH